MRVWWTLSPFGPLKHVTCEGGAFYDSMVFVSVTCAHHESRNLPP